MEETVSEEMEAVVKVETVSEAGGGYGRPLIVLTPLMSFGTFRAK
jgi:hypothetical protein